MTNTAKRICAWGVRNTIVGKWVDSEVFDRSRFETTEYVRKDITDELAEALERIERCMRVNYGRQNEKIADITQLATAALAKYKETET